jgi:hypothetical protein
MEVDSTLEQDIRKGQLEDAKIQEIKEQIKEDKAPGFSIDDQGTLWYKKCICVPEIKKSKSRYYVKLMTQLIPFTQEVLKCTMILRVDIGGME